jgi:hypothetical protein
MKGEVQAVNDRCVGELAFERERATELVSRFETLQAEFDRQKSELQRLQEAFTTMETNYRTLSEEIGTRPAPKVAIPRNETKSLDGNISHLSMKHGGNVQETGIVKITSKSVRDDDPKFAPQHVADLTSSDFFNSKTEPGQWVCWDFGEMRVCLTHYTMVTINLKSWVVEGSLDGRGWTEIDQVSDNQDFKKPHWYGIEEWKSASFSVSNRAEFRFIRLTQTAKNDIGYDWLSLAAVEFFGTLSE